MLKHVESKEMNAKELEDYTSISTKDYANELIKAGLVSEEEALPYSEKEFNKLLPKDGNTVDNCLYTMLDEDNNNVGMIWYKIRELFSEEVAFICDIRVNENYRHMGYGRSILRFFENEAKGKGVHKLGLNVFKHNTIATDLYESEGYTIQREAEENMYMVKDI
ncbi:MAG TPA: GNAT family N-acetyltransferase [Lachnospiraceae bacterium]|nr:GNAT family N-acetyltransferase [Lachnospiraceae bacterium]